VIRQDFALDFWKTKVRRSFFAWLSKEYYFREKALPVAILDGTKYAWGGEKRKGHYRHYWRAMCGSRYNEQQNSLVGADDFIERTATSSWWDLEDGSRPFFWRWSAEDHNQIIDGIPLWYRGTAPHNFVAQKKEKDP
jgi:hypothetical protein